MFLHELGLREDSIFSSVLILPPLLSWLISTAGVSCSFYFYLSLSQLNSLGQGEKKKKKSILYKKMDNFVQDLWVELRKPNYASAGQGVGWAWWAWKEGGEQDLFLSAAEKLNYTVEIGRIDLKEQLNDKAKVHIFWFF